MSKISEITAVTLPAAGDEFHIRDVSEAAADQDKSITHDDLLFGANGTPSTQAHSDSAVIGTALDAARSDHKHAMPAAGGGTEATQSDMEDGGTTNANRFVSPEVGHYGKWSAKGWVEFQGTGTVTDNISYNVTSITDNDTGDYEVVWATDFSSVHMAVVAMGQISHCSNEGATPSAGLFRVHTKNNSHAKTDSGRVCVIGFGDH